MNGEAPLIGLDWGTTRLRAYLIHAGDVPMEIRDQGPGIMAVESGGFPETARAYIGDWLESNPSAPIIASGMVGSRQGWIEVPYLACPARIDKLASALEGAACVDGRAVHFVPGLSFVDADGVPDVMRGEETQILGAMQRGGGSDLMLLPGTHSKWVWIRDECIQRFSTFMTGEVFGLLVEHGILGRLMDGTRWCEDAFTRGVRHASQTATAGGVLRQLFSARTLALFGKLAPGDTHAYLSGLLIGAEIREALAQLGDAGCGPGGITLIGGDELVRRYAAALKEAGVACTRAPSHSVAAGHLRLAREGGLL